MKSHSYSSPSWKHALSLIVLLAMALFVYAQNPAARQPPGGQRAPSTVGTQGPLPVHASFSAEAIESGGTLFQQNCAFCHGKDAGGGESGPDLTRSKLVGGDKNGEAIGDVVHKGRPEKGMPAFPTLTDPQIISLAAFVHSQQDKAMAQTGTRKGVDISDLQTGNLAAGKQYFSANCASCHSPTGDLAGVATRYQGLQLEQRMLYPRGAKSTVTVTPPSGKVLNGTLAYRDEFTVALTDTDGAYHSWPTAAVKYKVDSPADGHIALFSKYTDDDIHNLMAYIQTLR